MRIEIRAGDSRIVPTKRVYLTRTPGSAFGTFVIDIPYTVEDTNNMRVQVWKPGD
ncbi:hypothetical protein ACFLY4_00550 [Chloroflexota bacterium]